MNPRSIGYRFTALAALGVSTVEDVSIMPSPVRPSTLNVRVPLLEWLGVVSHLTDLDRGEVPTGCARLSYDHVWCSVDLPTWWPGRAVSDEGATLSSYWPLSQLGEAAEALRLLGVTEVDAWLAIAKARA